MADRPSLLSRPTGNAIPVGLDRARRLAWDMARYTDINQRLDGASDPTRSHWLHKLDLGHGYRFTFGRVVDAIAYVNAYKVQVEGGGTTMWC